MNRAQRAHAASVKGISRIRRRELLRVLADVRRACAKGLTESNTLMVSDDIRAWVCDQLRVLGFKGSVSGSIVTVTWDHAHPDFLVPRRRWRWFWYVAWPCALGSAAGCAVYYWIGPLL